MVVPLIWTVALEALLAFVAWPLLKKRPVVASLSEIVIFLACEIVVVESLVARGWTATFRLTALLCFCFAGLVLVWQGLGRRRWYRFRGGGFLGAMDVYETVAAAIRETCDLEDLAPAAVICRYDGWLGLGPLQDAEERMLFEHLEGALADTRWTRRGAWQLFFGVQWAVLALALVLQFVQLRGGF